MKSWVLSFMLFFPVFVYAGNESRNGGYVVKCYDLNSRAPKEQRDVKPYSLDYVLTRDNNDEDLINPRDFLRTLRPDIPEEKINDELVQSLKMDLLKESLRKIGGALSFYFSELGFEFEQFRKYLFVDDSSPNMDQHYFWNKGTTPLADYVLHNQLDRTKFRILEIKEDGERLEVQLIRDVSQYLASTEPQFVNRAITRRVIPAQGSLPEVITFDYDNTDILELPPLQASFLIVHEWLWKYVKEFDRLVKMNRLLHEESFVERMIDARIIQNKFRIRGFDAKYLKLRSNSVYEHPLRYGPLEGRKFVYTHIEFHPNSHVAKNISFLNTETIEIRNYQFPVSQLTQDKDGNIRSLVVGEKFKFGGVEFKKGTKLSFSFSLTVESQSDVPLNGDTIPAGSVFIFENAGEDLREVPGNFVIQLAQDAIIQGFHCQHTKGRVFNVQFTSGKLRSCQLSNNSVWNQFAFQKETTIELYESGYVRRGDLLSGTVRLRDFASAEISITGETEFYDEGQVKKTTVEVGRVNDKTTVMRNSIVEFREDGSLFKVNFESHITRIDLYGGVEAEFYGNSQQFEDGSWTYNALKNIKGVKLPLIKITDGDDAYAFDIRVTAEGSVRSMNVYLLPIELKNFNSEGLYLNGEVTIDEGGAIKSEGIKEYSYGSYSSRRHIPMGELDGTDFYISPEKIALRGLWRMQSPEAFSIDLGGFRLKGKFSFDEKGKLLSAEIIYGLRGDVYYLKEFRPEGVPSINNLKGFIIEGWFGGDPEIKSNHNYVDVSHRRIEENPVTGEFRLFNGSDDCWAGVSQINEVRYERRLGGFRYRNTLEIQIKGSSRIDLHANGYPKSFRVYESGWFYLKPKTMPADKKGVFVKKGSRIKFDLDGNWLRDW